MIEVVEFPYNQALNVWLVLVDGIVFQCFETEQAALDAETQQENEL